MKGYRYVAIGADCQHGLVKIASELSRHGARVEKARFLGEKVHLAFRNILELKTAVGTSQCRRWK